MSHPRTHRLSARRPTHRAPRRLVPTIASVVGAYAATALAVVLVVTVVLPVAAPRHAPLSAEMVTQRVTPAAAALDGRDAAPRVSRSMPVVRSLPRPAPVARRVVIHRITWALPVSGYHLTGRFGDRSYLWASGMHTGLDFAAPAGTQIRSVAAGVVRKAEYAGSYGNRTIISLPGGGEVWYCHQTSIAVRPGQRVTVGQPIGTVGSTGNVTGAHLHLEIRPTGEHGDPVDPYAVLLSHGLRP
jgi:murein DD-endopeptidase MepM/ murein hydrolase activator NlpD